MFHRIVRSGLLKWSFNLLTFTTVFQIRETEGDFY